MKTEAEKTALFELEKAVEGANQFDEYQKEIIESTKFIFDALELEVDKNKVHDLVCEIGDLLNARNPKMGTVMLALAELLRHGLVRGWPEELAVTLPSGQSKYSVRKARLKAARAAADALLEGEK